MKGTVLQKVARLGTDLVTHPRFAPRYLAHNLWATRSPLDLELPWFAYAAIEFLETFLSAGMRVCEYGTGGSTLFFARRVRAVWSIEDDPRWYNRVSQRLEEQQLTNVQIVLCPFDFKNPVGFETSAYLHAIPAQPFEVILVDGAEEWTPVRPACFYEAERHVADGGVIVVDDSWRYPGLRTRNRAKRNAVFQSVGPGRPGVTSTDVFFY